MSKVVFCIELSAVSMCFLVIVVVIEVLTVDFAVIRGRFLFFIGKSIYLGGLRSLKSAECGGSSVVEGLSGSRNNSCRRSFVSVWRQLF